MAEETPNIATDIPPIIDRKFHLSEVIDIDTMLKISNMFFSVVGINIIFVDNRGVPISPPLGSFPKWCQVHFDEKRVFKECLRCFQKGLINSICNKPTHIYDGPCGQTLISAPLYANNNVLLGCLITGPVQSESNVQKYPSHYFEHLGSLPVIASARFQAVAELISTLANFLTVSESLTRYQQEVVTYQQKLLDEARKSSSLEKEIVNYQLLLKETQLRELQAKMNPHFLFNALNIIARLAYTENAIETEKATFALADIARYGIDGHLKAVNLMTEMKHVEAYLHIQKIRFGDRVEVKINIDEKHHFLEILPYTIQPLVENAFNHGLESMPGKRTLCIYTKEDIDHQQINLIVEDDGKGIANDKYTFENWCFSPHTTLENIHFRIRELYGSEFGLKLFGPPEVEGTRAILVLPVKYEK